MSDSNGSQSMAEVKSVIISSQVGEQSGSIQVLQDDQRVEISFTLEQNSEVQSYKNKWLYVADVTLIFKLLMYKPYAGLHA